MQTANECGNCLQEMRVLLEPMTIMFGSKGYKLDDVIQEVRRMQTGWQHSDYRAWLKHYTTGKRPRSALEDSKQLLSREGGDSGAGPRDMGTGWLPASQVRTCAALPACEACTHLTVQTYLCVNSHLAFVCLYSYVLT